MDLAEFQAGFAGVNDHGFVGLQGISSKEEAAEVFKKIDDNGGGIVLLDEWSFFLKNCEIAMETAIGKILNEDQPGGVGKTEALFASTMAKPGAPKVTGAVAQRKPTTALTARGTSMDDVHGGAPPKRVPLKKGGGAGGVKAVVAKGAAGPAKSAAEHQAELREWIKAKSAAASDAPVNSFGLAVGKTASKELKDFIGVFEPLAAETPEGEKLREEGFITADPNGALL
jgi:hypothetical protein